MSGFASPPRGTRWHAWLAPALLLGAISACDDQQAGPAGPDDPASVSGHVTKGPVAEASVTLHAFAADGLPGGILGGPWLTASDGSWSAPPSSDPSLLAATGGHYLDEATATDVPMGTTRLLGYTTDGSGEVTPCTHTLAIAAAERIRADGLGPATAWSEVVAAFVTAFGFDPTSATPAGTGSTAGRTHQVLLGGISRLLAESDALAALSGAETADLVVALAEDLSNGRLDGTTAGGEPLLVETDLGDAPWPALDPEGIGVLVDAANDYAASTAGLGDIVLGPATLDFGDPDAGSGSGSVSLSGPGTVDLPVTELAPIAFLREEDTLQWSFNDGEGFALQIGVVRSGSDPGRASVVAVAAQLAGVSRFWSQVAQGSFVPGVTMEAESAAFTNVTLPPGAAGTELPIQIDGSLGP
jgi:hypothetical protein